MIYSDRASARVSPPDATHARSRPRATPASHAPNAAPSCNTKDDRDVLLKIACSRLRGHDALTLLYTGSLVHESFLRFVGRRAVERQSRKHFYACMARAMRHIVIDLVRRAQAECRGGDLQQVTFDTALLHALPDPAGTSVLDFDRAMNLAFHLISTIRASSGASFDSVAVARSRWAWTSASSARFAAARPGGFRRKSAPCIVFRRAAG